MVDRLYRNENPKILPFEDYDLIVSIVSSLKCKVALEFGPGATTLALLDAGVETVDTYEHNQLWFDRAQHSLRTFRDQQRVFVHMYKNDAKIHLPSSPRIMFDVAIVDSPVGVSKRRHEFPGQEGCARLNTLRYACEHARVVLLHDAHRMGEINSLNRVESEGLTQDITVVSTLKGLAIITTTHSEVRRAWNPNT
jgi:hypothetical protein